MRHAVAMRGVRLNRPLQRDPHVVVDDEVLKNDPVVPPQLEACDHAGGVASHDTGEEQRRPLTVDRQVLAATDQDVIVRRAFRGDGVRALGKDELRRVRCDGVADVLVEILETALVERRRNEEAGAVLDWQAGGRPPCTPRPTLLPRNSGRLLVMSGRLHRHRSCLRKRRPVDTQLPRRASSRSTRYGQAR